MRACASSSVIQKAVVAVENRSSLKSSGGVAPHRLADRVELAFRSGRHPQIGGARPDAAATAWRAKSAMRVSAKESKAVVDM